jgi:CheY-like chemotaxis protein
MECAMLILILDDYLQAAQLIEELIHVRFPDIETHIATTYFDAVGQYSLVVYDMIICDVDLHDPHDGWYFVKHCTQHGNLPKIVVYSAKPIEANEPPVNLRLEKPINTNTLLSYIESIFMANYPEWKDLKETLDAHHKTCQENNDLLYSKRPPQWMQITTVLAIIGVCVAFASRQVTLEERMKQLRQDTDTSISTVINQNNKIIELLSHSSARE